MAIYDLTQRMRQSLYDIGEGLVLDIREEMVNYSINASGELSRSLEYRVDDNTVEVLANDYITYAQFGRGPGKVPYDFPSIIAKWAVDKGIAIKGRPLDFGWAVATKIRRYGSAKYRGDSPKTDILGKPVEKALESVDSDLTAVLMESVNDIV